MDVRKSVKINGIGAQGPGGCSLRCLVAPRGLTAAAYGRLGAWQEQLAGPLQLARTAGKLSAPWSQSATAKFFRDIHVIYIDHIRYDIFHIYIYILLDNKHMSHAM